jgi:hypothetical protein
MATKMGDAQDREARLRRMASKQGLILGRERRSKSGASRYILFADPDRASATLSGTEQRSPLEIDAKGYEGSIDEIEAYLTRGELLARK